MTTTTPKTTARNIYPGRCGGFNPWIRDLAQALMGTHPPEPDGIMSHHGLYFSWRGLTLTIAPHMPNTLRLTLERDLSRCDWKRAHGRKAEAGLKRRTWRRMQAAMALAFGKTIVERWNGEDNHATASMLIECPKALRWMHGAVANYGALPSVFEYGEETKALFSKVGYWHRTILEHYAVKCREPRIAYHRIDSATIHRMDTAETITITGRLFRPLEHDPEQRPEAFKAALAKVYDIGRRYFPEGELAITTQPTPRP